jgi:hypothetical protein
MMNLSLNIFLIFSLTKTLLIPLFHMYTYFVFFVNIGYTICISLSKRTLTDDEEGSDFVYINLFTMLSIIDAFIAHTEFNNIL